MENFDVKKFLFKAGPKLLGALNKYQESAVEDSIVPQVSASQEINSQTEAFLNRQTNLSLLHSNNTSTITFSPAPTSMNNNNNVPLPNIDYNLLPDNINLYSSTSTAVNYSLMPPPPHPMNLFPPPGTAWPYFMPPSLPPLMPELIPQSVNLYNNSNSNNNLAPSTSTTRQNVNIMAGLPIPPPPSSSSSSPPSTNSSSTNNSNLENSTIVKELQTKLGAIENAYQKLVDHNENLQQIISELVPNSSSLFISSPSLPPPSSSIKAGDSLPITTSTIVDTTTTNPVDFQVQIDALRSEVQQLKTLITKQYRRNYNPSEDTNTEDQETVTNNTIFTNHSEPSFSPIPLVKQPIFSYRNNNKKNNMSRKENERILAMEDQENEDDPQDELEAEQEEAEQDNEDLGTRTSIDSSEAKYDEQSTLSTNLSYPLDNKKEKERKKKKKHKKHKNKKKEEEEEDYELETANQDHAPTCCICQKASAKYYCLECKDYFCEENECNKIMHEPKERRKHTRKKLEE